MSLNFKSRVTMVTNLIISTLDYCNSVLAGSNNATIRPLQLVLNRAVRFIYKPGRRSHITPYLKMLHILPISYRIKFKTCLISFKVYNKMAPSYLDEDFVKFQHHNNINLRTGCGRDPYMFKVTLPHHRKDTILEVFKNEWNALPLSVRMETSLQLFKKKLKTHFFKLAFPDNAS